MVSADYINKIGSLLNNPNYSLKQRFRALFTLKNLGGTDAIDHIARCFSDKSALLKHELAYCLGQMRDPYAVPKLIELLEDENQETVVRHEAAEALGAIGNHETINVLRKYENDNIQELSETCQLAIKRLEYLSDGGVESRNAYGSVDPTPPSNEIDVHTLRKIFLDDNQTLYDRYRSMFALRDINSDESILCLTEGLQRGSVLFRHEVAFVLGQLQSPLSIPALKKVVENTNENDIVRHESIEALGSIGTDACMEIIKCYLNDKDVLVRESCEVALDMCDYENSAEFQYANGLEIVSQQC